MSNVLKWKALLVINATERKSLPVKSLSDRRVGLIAP